MKSGASGKRDILRSMLYGLLPLCFLGGVVGSATVLLSACAVPENTVKSTYYANFRHDREVLMRSRWTGRLYVDLVADMGRDGVSMTTPDSSGQTSSAVIFGINDPISGCVDSFVVINGDEPIIEDYYCR